MVAPPCGLGSCNGCMDLIKDIGCKEREARDCNANLCLGDKGEGHRQLWLRYRAQWMWMRDVVGS